MTLEIEHARARRGIAFLDRRLGPGWRRKIRRRKLNMGNGCNCVLGQLYGGYVNALQTLGIARQTETRYGFDGTTSTEVWLEELRR